MARVVQASSAEQLSAEAKSSLPQYSQRSQLILFFYLLGYNQVSFLGWFWVLYTTLFRLFSTGFEYERVHELVWPALVIVQSGAVIEIINSAFRFVRAPVTTTFLQVISRLFLVWAVNYMFPDVRSHWSFSTMMVAWSIAECVRYSYYGFNLLGSVPRVLTWARYNFFLVLYPLGVGSELLMVYKALPLAYEWNPMYFYFLIAASLVYLPGFPILFSHMLVQRKKYLKGTYQVAEKKKGQ